MRYITLIALIVAAFSARAQVIKDVPPPSSKPDYTYDCSKLDYQSDGCKSYDQMVSSNDKDVLADLGLNQNAFVCFRPNEDTFFIISFDQPPDFEFKAINTGTTVLAASGLLGYDRYKNGVNDDEHLIIGKWSEIKGIPSTLTFASRNTPPSTSASISDTEIDYGQSFLNLNNTTTQYAFQLRRSTLRFNETFSAPEPAQAGTKQTKLQSHSQDEFTVTGYCAKFQHTPNP